MSLTTTCSLFWVDVYDNVVEVDHDKAVCDSTYTSCTITGSHGGTLAATCNSKQQYPDTTSSYYTSYFCACNGNSASIPDGVTCSPACYNLQTKFPTCNVVWLYNGFTSGSISNIVKQDTCTTYTCDSNGYECTDSTVLYQCDNKEHDSPIADDSNDSYVCNCAGAAQIPALYRGTNGASVGSGCNGNKVVAPSSSSKTNVIVVATTAPAATTAPIIVKSSTPVTTSMAVPETTSAAASTSSGSNPKTSAGSPLAVSRVLLLSLCSSIALRLLFP